ncbi:DNA recombination protein RmuC [Kaistella jeonii]|uniref:Recombinase RmuC n=1 Tax=Kaistella jeonii TaxID=266749 RepID=A0A0C1FPJ3_9FLAO|nr:DNA recombination protein RmuC [Kaistella jeonii]KIA89794.1 recombinase RmuC [Kaistella jeonii]SFB86155.1 DNA recombination protein RmuC [Kaistella jeonii]VEI96028.1 DNA recombination protein rmuC [Kaistella jeonii]
MKITTLIIGITLGAILGAVLIYFILKSSNVSRNSYDELNENFIKSNADLQNSTSKKEELLAQNSNLILEIKNFQNEKENLITTKSQLSAKNENLQSLLETQKEEISKMQELAKIEFQNLANKILEEKTEKFTTLNQTQLKTILEPLGENLKIFKKRVNEVYENEARERFSLNSTIKLMMEQTTKISQEANNLATALKGQSKTQGDWGEMILERILEDSGLTKDREYYSQYNIKNEAGENQRPDFVLKLPGNQLVIIDSKVSLNAYERMVSAENDEDRKQNLSLHIAAVKKHIDTLSQKKYDDLKESLDFTIMFVPVEPAFLTAVQFDSQLWNYAYHKHIILLSPTNLIAYLKLISDVWKRADHNQNALEIAERGGKLYDKFVSFVENLEKVGKNIDNAKNSYNDAFKQLATGNDNLVTQTQKLKQLGAKNRKTLPSTLTENADNQIDFSE